MKAWLLWGLWMLLALAMRLTLVGWDFIAYTLAFLGLVWAARRILGRFDTKLSKTLGVCMTIALWLLGIWFAATELYLITGARTDASRTPDYMVVLGAQVRGSEPSRSMQDRVRAAAGYLQDHPSTICIVSGGQGHGEELSEAACMQNMLLEAGIDPERIWLEDRSTDTAENIAYSLDLIEARTGQRPTELGIVSSEYHLRRAELVAKNQDCVGIGIVAPTSLLYLKINYFIREAFGIWYYALLK